MGHVEQAIRFISVTSPASLLPPTPPCHLPLKRDALLVHHGHNAAFRTPHSALPIAPPITAMSVAVRNAPQRVLSLMNLAATTAKKPPQLPSSSSIAGSSVAGSGGTPPVTGSLMAGNSVGDIFIDAPIAAQQGMEAAGVERTGVHQRGPAAAEAAGMDDMAAGVDPSSVDALSVGGPVEATEPADECDCWHQVVIKAMVHPVDGR